MGKKKGDDKPKTELMADFFGDGDLDWLDEDSEERQKDLLTGEELLAAPPPDDSADGPEAIVDGSQGVSADREHRAAAG